MVSTQRTTYQLARKNLEQQKYHEPNIYLQKTATEIYTKTAPTKNRTPRNENANKEERRMLGYRPLHTHQPNTGANGAEIQRCPACNKIFLGTANQNRHISRAPGCKRNW